jgi:hypothetical protein
MGWSLRRSRAHAVKLPVRDQLIHENTPLSRRHCWRDRCCQSEVMLETLSRVGCLIGGHDDYIVRSRNRMYLHCERCGRSTVGWAVGRSALQPNAVRIDEKVTRRWGAVVAHFSQRLKPLH